MPCQKSIKEISINYKRCPAGVLIVFEEILNTNKKNKKGK